MDNLLRSIFGEERNRFTDPLRRHGSKAPTFSRLIVPAVGVAVVSASLAAASGLSQNTPLQRVEIPAGATSLEGIPTVRIDSAEGKATRRLLDTSEAAGARLKVKVIDGQFYWTTRGNRPLRLNSSGEFTYLSSEPGQYIRLTRLNDRISYIEHVDVTSGSVTWFGELRIVVGK